MKVQARFRRAFLAAATLFLVFMAWPLFGLQLITYTVGFAWTVLGLNPLDLRQISWTVIAYVIWMLLTGLATVAYVVYAALALVVAKTVNLRRTFYVAWFVAVPLLAVAIDLLTLTQTVPLLWGFLRMVVLASPLAVYMQLNRQVESEILSLSTLR